MGFLDSYKRLDNLCKDTLKSDTGITSYLDAMEHSRSGAASVPGWQDDYRALKHYRYIRNKIAHENGADEKSLCGADDVRWLEKFYNRLLRRTDPLSRCRERGKGRPGAEAQRAAPRKQRNYSHKKRSSSRHRGGFVFIAVAVLLFLAYIFLRRYI